MGERAGSERAGAVRSHTAAARPPLEGATTDDTGRALAHATRLTRVLTVLSEPAQADALVDRLLETLSELFAADVVSLLLVDAGRLRESAALGLTEPGAPSGLTGSGPPSGRVVADPRAEQALTTLEPVRARVSQEHGALAAAGVDQGLWLPVQGVSEAVGVLRLMRQGEPFADEDVEVLSAIALRVGLALEADRIRACDRQRSAMRERMLAITAEMARRLEFEPVAQRIVDGVTAVTDFSCAVVALRDGEVCRQLAASGFSDARIGVETPYADWAALLDPARRRGELCHRIPAAAATPPWASQRGRVGADEAGKEIPAGDGTEMPAGDDMRAGVDGMWTSGGGLVLALSDPDGETVGFLAVDRPRSGGMPDDDTVSALELFARQAQVALANARLFELVRRQRDAATTLRRVGETVSSSLELDDVLLRCCDEVIAVSAGNRASIYLFDENRQAFVPVISRAADDRPELTVRFRELPPAPAATMPAFSRALGTRSPVTVENASPGAHLRRADIDLLGLTSVAIYPMRAGGQDVGVLVVDAVDRSQRFPADEIALLHQVAGQAAVAVRQARLYAETRALAGTMRELYDIAKAVTSTFDVESMFDRIAEAARERLGAEGMAMFEVVEGEVRAIRAEPPGEPPPARPTGEDCLTRTVSQLLTRLRAQGTVVIGDAAQWPQLGHLSAADTRGLLVAAHVEQGDVTVGLAVSSPRPHAFGPADAAFLGQLVETTGLALRHARLYAETRRAAERDSLTGLRNRRVFWTDLNRVLADPAAAPVALAVVDVDDFKRINDDNGHDAGDRALAHVADRLTRSVRQTDAVYRVGGEEFAVVMTTTTGEAACGVMERGRDAVQRSRATSAVMSVSVGVAVGRTGTTGDELFRAADRALYRAKRSGKDRIALADARVGPAR